MKILYATQGTGNGHLSRAADIIPILQSKGELDVLVSGTQVDMPINYPVKYRLDGLSFVFGKRGGVNIASTLFNARVGRFLKEVRSVPVEEYDLIINDFEPVSAWACRLNNKTCVGLSHQSAILSPNTPQPKPRNLIGEIIYKNYAPVSKQYGFHFNRFDKQIFTPVIRRQIRELNVTDKGHYTVYLPAYGDAELFNFFSTFSNATWEIFSKHNKSAFRLKNVQVRPLNQEAFTESLAACTGVICGAGFETPSEALFLGKKLLVVPMKNQYEQQCNAEVLRLMGVSVIKELRSKHISTIGEWIESGKATRVNYPDITANVIDLIIDNHFAAVSQPAPYIWNEQPFEISPA